MKYNPKNKSLNQVNNYLIIGAFIVFILFLVWQDRTHDTLDSHIQLNASQQLTNISLPRTIPPNSNLNLQFIPTKGKTQNTELNIVFTNTLYYSVNTVSSRGLRGDILSPENVKHCRKLDNNQTSCQLLIQEGGQIKTVELYTKNGSSTIQHINARILSSVHQTTFLGQHSALIVLILLASIPIVWLLHRSRKISQWYILGTATVILYLIQPIFLAGLLAFLSLAFFIGKMMSTPKYRHATFLLLFLVATLGYLAICKYGMNILNEIFPKYGSTNLGLPLGISYFVIRLIDTQLCWYRGELQDVSLREYLCYILFPTTIPAGPIETLNNFRNNRLSKITKLDISYGVSRTLIGLFKKIVVASFFYYALYGNGSGSFQGFFGYVVTSYHLAISNKTTLFLFLSFLYAYIDFSAYSDIAIGLSRLLGYPIVENFTWPIIAVNLHQFWRSWHRSLSLWCFRNIYFPLTIKTRNIYIPLYVTMITVGLWHQIGLSWLAWAIYHASGLSVLSFLDRQRKFKLPAFWFTLYCKPIRILITLVFVAGGYSFVSVANFSTALTIFFHYWINIFTLGHLL